MSEQDPLLVRNYATDSGLTSEGEAIAARGRRTTRARACIGLMLVALFVVGITFMLSLGNEGLGRGGLPKDPAKAAERVLFTSPVIVRS
jgi:hypothetical protein